MHRLFSISELLRHIFLSVDWPSARNILQFVLVLKFWADIALPLLWGHPDENIWRCESSGKESELGALARLIDMELMVALYSLFILSAILTESAEGFQSRLFEDTQIRVAPPHLVVRGP